MTNSANKVHFHDEVRVKKIKATGKNRPLDDDSDDERGGGHIDESESEESEELDDSDQEMTEEAEEAEGSSGDSESVVDDNATIQRLKSDLFADDDDEVEDGKA